MGVVGLLLGDAAACWAWELGLRRVFGVGVKPAARKSASGAPARAAIELK